VPQINEKSKKIQRSEKVEEILLEDAKRRKQKKSDNEKGRPEDENKGNLVSKKSQKVYYQRFISDF
jgi:hypothetical protein